MKKEPILRLARNTKYLVAIPAALLLGLHTSQAALVKVDIELSLVADVSGSVSGSQYSLQMNGYASAFESTQLHNVIATAPYGVAVNLIQFSGSSAESIPWTLITDAASANAFAGQIRSAARLFSGSTSVDSGVNTGTSGINSNNYDGDRKIILVSGDGYSGSSGSARDNALANGIDTVTGIVIGDASGNIKDDYEQNVVGGPNSAVASAPTFQDFEAEILRLLTFQITGISGDGFPVAATLRQSQITLARAGLNDVNSRLFSLRTRRGQATPAPVVPASGKEGADSAKGIIIEPPAIKRWEAFGSIHYLNHDVEGASAALPGTTLRIPTLAEYEMDIYGGTAGIEYKLTDQWSIGAAIIGNSADIDMASYGDIDSDGGAIALYASYYLAEAFGGPGDLYADLLYSYGAYDNDIRRTTAAGIARGSTESDNHTLELNLGYNLRQSDWIHGPYASVTWTDGELDAFNETGPGAIAYPAMDYDSLLGEIGYQVSKVIPTSKGTLVPQVRLGWEHEFKNDTAYIGTFPLAGLEEDHAIVGLTLGWKFSDNGQAVIDYEGRISSDSDMHQVSVRIGIEF